MESLRPPVLNRGVTSTRRDSPGSPGEHARHKGSHGGSVAACLINQLGYRGASVDRISAELGATKGSFYHHHETRDGLVVACFEQTFALVRRAQDLALAGGADGLSKAAAAAVWLVTRQMRDHGALLRTSALTAISPELRAKVAREVSRVTLRFRGMLNDGLADGSVRLCDVRIAAEMITAAINPAEELKRCFGERLVSRP